MDLCGARFEGKPGMCQKVKVLAGNQRFSEFGARLSM